MENKDNRTLAELAKEALDVQDACNLSGVVHAWSRAITRLREVTGALSTTVINEHPINKVPIAERLALSVHQSIKAYRGKRSVANG